VSQDGSYRYQYRDAVNGFFEIPTELARRLLKGGLQPVELHHGTGILAVTAFDFQDSSVGAYREIALSIITPPRLFPGEPMPRAAMFPFLLGTSTPEARRHAIEVWHLPHHPHDLTIEITRGEGEFTLSASDHAGPILDFSLRDPGVPWQKVEHTYQTFMQDDDGAYMSPLLLTGSFMEHEEERGSLRLSRHAFTSGLDLDEVPTTPFREQWMRQGVEIISPLQRLAALAGR
jgi:hypothetical protein